MAATETLPQNGDPNAASDGTKETTAIKADWRNVPKQKRALLLAPKFTGAQGNSKLSLPKPYTKKARRIIRNKTTKLIETRNELDEALIKEDRRKKPTASDWLPRQNLLRRAVQLRRREERHLKTRTKVYAQREKYYRWDPTSERGHDVDLIRELLWKFQRNLTPVMLDNFETPRRSSGDDDAQDAKYSSGSESSGDEAAEGAEYNGRDWDVESKSSDDKDEQQDHKPSQKDVASSVSSSQISGESKKRKLDVSPPVVTVKRHKSSDESSSDEAADGGQGAVDDPASTEKRRKTEAKNSKKLKGSTTKPTPSVSAQGLDGAFDDIIHTAPRQNPAKPGKTYSKKEKAKRLLVVKDTKESELKQKHVGDKEAKPPGQRQRQQQQQQQQQHQLNDDPIDDYFKTRAEEMRSNPLGYNDLVHEDERPHRRRPAAKSSAYLMSGGLGSPAPQPKVAKRSESQKGADLQSPTTGKIGKAGVRDKPKDTESIISKLVDPTQAEDGETAVEEKTAKLVTDTNHKPSPSPPPPSPSSDALPRTLSKSDDAVVTDGFEPSAGTSLPPKSSLKTTKEVSTTPKSVKFDLEKVHPTISLSPTMSIKKVQAWRAARLLAVSPKT